MMDALQTMKFLRKPGTPTGATPMAAAPKATATFGGLTSSKLPNPGTLEKDVFQKKSANDSGAVPKGGKIVNAAHAAPLEKPAPLGGLGGFFQALKSKLNPESGFSALPAPARHSVQTLQEIQQATQKVNPAAHANPFKTMEAIILGKSADLAGLQNPALKTNPTPPTQPNFSKQPLSGLAAMALPFAGISLLAAPVLAPTALVVNPGLLNPAVNLLPVLIP